MITFENLKSEFILQGYNPSEQVIKTACKLLNAEDIEMDDTHMCAFVLGWTLGLSQILTK